LFYSKGLYSFSDRITSGGLASPGQFPYVVSITENGRHFCGGFIYSSKWVVTAAACVEGYISILMVLLLVGVMFNINDMGVF
jgi:secreted trypsin-like serine protease